MLLETAFTLRCWFSSYNLHLCCLDQELFVEMLVTLNYIGIVTVSPIKLLQGRGKYETHRATHTTVIGVEIIHGGDFGKNGRLVGVVHKLSCLGLALSSLHFSVI